MKAIANIDNSEYTFAPITLTLSTPFAVANVLGALMAYGRGEVYAENGLKAIGLGGYYSGNVRAAARDAATKIAEAAGLDELDFSEVKLTGRKSKAGEFVVGTEFDLAPGRASTTFEAPLEVEVEEDDDYEDEGITVTL